MDVAGVCRKRKKFSGVVETLESRIFLSSNTSVVGAIGYNDVEGSVAQQIYVDQSAVGSTQTGAIDQPYLTINAALASVTQKNQQNIGVKVIIKPGTYREKVEMHAPGGFTNAPIVFEASSPGKVTVSGSDIYTGWVADPGNANNYTHSWTNNWGFTPNPWPGLTTIGPLALRRELVFANGQNLTEVLNYNDLSTGTFYVDENADKMFVRMPAGMNIATSKMEVGVRSGVMIVQGYNNVVIRGMNFVHDVSELTSGGGTGALWIANGNNILLENDQVMWSDQAVSILALNNVTVRNLKTDNNAFGGMGAWHVKDSLIEGVETNNNNWRGVQGDFTTWATAGIKALMSHNLAFRDITAIDNDAPGIWLDTDVANCDISGSFLSGNIEAGIIVEAVQGPISITNNIITKNAHGLDFWCASGVTVQNNIFYDNDLSQAHISGAPGGRPISNYETNQSINVLNVNWTIKNNAFATLANNKPALDNTLPAADFNSFTGTLTASDNVWYSATTSQVFQVVNGVKQTLPQWQAATGKDQNSVNANPSFADPANNNFAPTASTPSVVNLPEVIPGSGTGLTAQYFANTSLAGAAVTRKDWLVNFNWANGSPDPSIGATNYSARWSGQVEARYTEPYTFYTLSDDGARLYVNGQLVIDDWAGHPATEKPSDTINLVAGQKYSIVMEYRQFTQGAVAALKWSSTSTAKQIIPMTQLSPGNLISGNVFNDPNSTGVKDPTDVGIGGWTVYLDANNNNAFDVGEASTITSASGDYDFANVPSGTQHVRQVIQSGYRKTNPGAGVQGYEVVLSGGSVATGKDFGNTTNILAAGTVYDDANSNGMKDPGDVGLAGIVVNIISNGVTVASRTTDANGFWRVQGLSAGSGSAELVMPGDRMPTFPIGGAYQGSMSSGERNQNLNFGLHQVAAVANSPNSQILILAAQTSKLIKELGVFGAV